MNNVNSWYWVSYAILSFKQTICWFCHITPCVYFWRFNECKIHRSMRSAAYEESQSARLYNDASLPFYCKCKCILLHLVKLLMKYQLPRSITREVRVLKPFPFLVDLGEGQLWYFNFFVLSRFLERTSSENSLLGWHFFSFLGRTSQKKHLVCTYI